MKKIIFALVIALLSGSAIAQTPEDKAAVKAAKAAQKEATKAANKQLSDGMKCSDEVHFCQQAIQMEKQNGESANQKLIAENEAKILTLSLQGIDYLTGALSTEYIKDNKKFAAYRALDEMSSIVINDVIQKYQAKESYDLAAFAKATHALSEAYHGQITYGNTQDQAQNLMIQSAKLQFPKAHVYYAYLCDFCIKDKDMDAAQKALDAYVQFPVNYPEVADNEKIKNPDYPASQLAFNIFYTAFTEKNADLMDKYYDLALQFEDKESHNFVLRAKAELLREQGKTEEWVAALKNIIATEHNSEVGEIAMHQLMSHYNNVGQEAVEAYTAEMVEKYPNNRTANYCRGFAFYSKNNFDEAIKYFEKSVEIDPTYSEGVYNCAYCHYQNALAKARAISGQKMKSQAAINEAEAEVKALFAKAAPYFERFREMEPTADTSKWANPLKVIYSNIGEKDKAAEMEAYIN